MRFALTQMDITWENPVENRRLCTELTEQAAAHPVDEAVRALFCGGYKFCIAGF